MFKGGETRRGTVSGTPCDTSGRCAVTVSCVITDQWLFSGSNRTGGSCPGLSGTTSCSAVELAPSRADTVLPFWSQLHQKSTLLLTGWRKQKWAKRDGKGKTKPGGQSAKDCNP